MTEFSGLVQPLMPTTSDLFIPVLPATNLEPRPTDPAFTRSANITEPSASLGRGHSTCANSSTTGSATHVGAVNEEFDVSVLIQACVRARRRHTPNDDLDRFYPTKSRHYPVSRSGCRSRNLPTRTHPWGHSGRLTFHRTERAIDWDGGTAPSVRHNHTDNAGYVTSTRAKARSPDHSNDPDLRRGMDPFSRD